MVLPAPDAGTWYVDVLARLQLEPTVDRNQALALWAVSEGMPATSFNWLAATDPRPGSVRYNGAGVQEYPNYPTGVEVVATKLSSSLYRPILTALQRNSADQAWQAINASPWCKGCQNGKYPEALYSWLAAGRPSGGPGDPGPEPGPPNQQGPAGDSWDADIRWVAQHHDQVAVHLQGIAAATLSLVR